MRCQRVRFYLSAYCKGELAGGRRKALAAHLERCPECQREELTYREVLHATAGVSQLRVSARF